MKRRDLGIGVIKTATDETDGDTGRQTGVTEDIKHYTLQGQETPTWILVTW